MRCRPTCWGHRVRRPLAGAGQRRHRPRLPGARPGSGRCGRSSATCCSPTRASCPAAATSSVYAAGMDASMAVKLEDIGPHIVAGRIVDKGCGTGKLLVHLSRLFPESQIVGLDLSRELLRTAESQHYVNQNVSIVKANIVHRHFPPGTVSTVIFSSVMHEIYSYTGYDREPVRLALRNTAQELRPGGRVIIRDGVSPGDGRSGCAAMPRLSAVSAASRASSRGSRRRRASRSRSGPHDGRTWFVLSLHDANEFLSKKDYLENWAIEVNEEFGVFTLAGWRHELEQAGYRVLEARSYLNPWILEHRYRGRGLAARRRRRRTGTGAAVPRYARRSSWVRRRRRAACGLAVLDRSAMATEGRPAVVLLSGGLDSATALAVARRDGFRCHALTINYGQRHAAELEAARRVARAQGAAQHRIIDMDLRSFGGSALTDDLDVPKDRPADEMAEGIPITYVPARNTVFLSLALAWAEVLGQLRHLRGDELPRLLGLPRLPAGVHPGVRAAGQPRQRRRASRGRGKFTIHTPLIHLHKADIIRLGQGLGVDYGLTHSCYDPAPDGSACGHCDSCQLRRDGFEAAGVPDPTRYAAAG